MIINYNNRVRSIFYFLRILSHFYVGLMIVIRRLNLTRSCASSPDSSLSDKSLLMLSNHLHRSSSPFPPGPSITRLPIYSYSLLKTCSYHFHLLSCTFLDISPTFVVPLVLSFLILSSLVTPLIHLNILISNFSINIYRKRMWSKMQL